ncbi:Xaa-Pro peptidase family protein [Pseudomonas sp. LA21]|uniref:M24 family metallopeptidase n=1 Tax=unclassified Pseudomonas TaxID=196821 RepID=UPI001FB57A42|nr:Xaa-Pro peptidase family protein [Pseudomonas sp. LA21]MCJ1884895.1 Xaa-Pro peptidase family protein [Pseudomonas sp. LA21]
MTLGVGGVSSEQALARLPVMTAGAAPITLEEYRQRIERLQQLMRAQGMAAVFVDAGSSLFYFTGLKWNPSERMVGALVPARGEVHYIAPAFEEGTVLDLQVLPGSISVWAEHESPFTLLIGMLAEIEVGAGARVGLSHSLPFGMYERLRQVAGAVQLVDAGALVEQCRRCKSPAELALMQRAKDMTLEVHKAAASILREGITTLEVTRFIEAAHRKVGAPGSTFCIVLFGEDSAFPHGVRQPRPLRDGDMVLIDTGCQLYGYNSDITRSYVFGTPSARQRELWNLEKAAQQAAFDAAVLGSPCELVDAAARRCLEAGGLGPDYALPGLPHRTGHGIGLDIHEGPYLVRGDSTPLDVGMCFSNEPMICVPGEFGIRLEDHFYMTAEGPRWFTRPSHSVDDPFGLEA